MFNTFLWRLINVIVCSGFFNWVFNKLGFLSGHTIPITIIRGKNKNNYNYYYY